MVDIDNRLIQCDSTEQIEEDFNRVMALIDKLEAVARVYVTFDSDGGSAVSQQIIKFGEKATEPDDPTKTDYTFIGWFDGEAEAPFDFDTELEEDITLTAHWEAEE